MPSLDVLNLEGQRVGQISLSDDIFGAPVREHLLWEAVKAQLAARRSGTASTKVRSEVRGSTRKIYKQKGTGRARHGSIRAPIFVGGGVALGPKPRSYAYTLPKKVRRGALISALSLRAAEKRLVVMEDLRLGETKTKRMAGVLAKLGVTSGLIIDDKGNVELIRSVRNLAKAKYLAPEGLNVYDLLRYETLVVTAPVAKQIEERLSR
ncbi:MAG: 50S ribosomal protein L4 [Deltaproteobacteria bacterium]|nr:50S ribosomal protein L4 [Deltaproteobacteria bacterium]